MRQLYIFFFFVFGSYLTLAQDNWQFYTEVADSLQSKNQFNLALKYRLKAVGNARISKKDTLSFLEFLMEMSRNEAIFSKSKKIEAYNDLKIQAQQLKNFNPSKERLYKTYNLLYGFSEQLRNTEDSDYFITKSLDYQYQSSKIDSLQLIRNLQKAGTTYRKIGKLNESVEMFQRAVALCEELNLNNANLLGYNYLGLSEAYRYRFLDDPKKFLEYLKKAQVIYEEAHAIDEMMAVYFGLSNYMNGIGKFQTSLNYLKKAFQVYQTDVDENANRGIDTRDIRLEIKLHNHFIDRYRLLDNEKQMMYHLDEILRLAKPEVLTDAVKDLVSLSYMYLVSYYEEDKQELALSFLEDGRQFFPEEDLYFIKEEYDMHEAKILIYQNKYDKASAILKELRNKSGLPLFIEKTTLENCIIVSIKAENYTQAYQDIETLLVNYFDAKKDVDIKEMKLEHFRASTVISDTKRFLNIAKAFAETPHTKITRKLYWMAQRQFQENLKKEVLNDEINSVYSNICQYFYSEASKGLLGETEIREFLTFTEHIESKSLLNTFVNNRGESNATEVDSLIKSERLIRSNVTNLKKLYSKNRSDSINQLLFEEQIKLEKIQSKLKTNNHKIVELLSTENLFERIKDNYIIKFKIHNDVLFRIELDGSGAVKINKVEDYATLKEKIKETIILLKDPSSSVNRIKDKTNVLYSKLLGKTQIANQFDTVYIIPDDILHYLPFELLTIDNAYLLEKTTIGYASALSFIKANSDLEKPNHKRHLALFAPSYNHFAPTDEQLAVRGEPYYLEGTIKEVKGIRHMFSNSDMFINDDATKQSFLELSNDYTILHLSMHSFIDDEDAELSSLVFTDGTEDYELYISELYGLNLNAYLAVLSACNTGVGELKTGSGVVSMNTAFISAGVPSVLSSLWSAPDLSTQKIMISFYEHLKSGSPKDLALKNAKLEYLKNTDDTNLKHPYYWAGFVLSGDTTPLIESNNKAQYIVLAILILAALVFFKINKSRT